MLPFRQHRLFANACLVLLVLVIARVAGRWGANAETAALVVVALMAGQTLMFARPRAPGGRPRRRFTRLVALRAVGFIGLSTLVMGSYVLQRAFILGDTRPRAILVCVMIPLGFSALIDLRSRPYVDEYWTLGRILVTRRWRWNDTLRRDVGSVGIKTFFYPLMFVYLEQYLGLFARHWRPETWSIADLYDALIIYSFLIDLAFGASAYALSLRILGNRVRSVNPYPLGWAVTLVCYSPFFDLLGRIVVFRWQPDWLLWSSDWPIVQGFWLLLIACSFVVYTWATIELGPKFSNLAYRGTVSSGPYRLLKHPAYTAKIASYLLVSTPFIPSHGAAFALEQCAALTLLGGIYYLRARYEEKHLMQFPDYRVYAAERIWRPREMRPAAS